MSTSKDRSTTIASARSQPPSVMLGTAVQWFTEGHQRDARRLLELVPESQLNRVDTYRYRELAQTVGAQQPAAA